MAKKTKTRPRGGASFPCPGCEGPTRVLDTRRLDHGKVVQRLRECLAKPKHRFLTHEKQAGRLGE